MRSTRRQCFGVVSTISAALVLLAAAGTAGAAQRVIHAEATINDATFHDAYLTARCGFDVNDTLSAHTTATGYLGGNGRVVSEFDTWNGTWTYSAPATGKSVVRPLNLTVTSSYGDGAVEGGSGVATATGQGAGTYLGGPAGSGTYSATVQVVAFDVSGIPFTVITGVVSSRGEFDRGTRAVCAALR